MTDRMVALQMDRQIQQLQQTGVRGSKQISVQLRLDALRALRTKRLQHLDAHKVISNDMTTTLVNGMLVAYLQGMEASRKAAHKAEMSLDVYTSVLQKLKERSKLSTTKLDAIQRKLQTRVYTILNDVSDKTEKQLRGTVADLISEGTTKADAISALDDTLDNLGLSPKSDFQLETIYRTQTQLAYSAGRWDSDQSPEIQEILWGYKYVTVGDDRVRPEHEALEGTTLEKTDAFWNKFFPPNGWNCRCQAIPIYEPRTIVQPPRTLDDGTVIEPDKGFAFNPGNAI